MKKYVIVSGGELHNKGAQAMSFITVEEIKKRFPNYTVVLLSEKDYMKSKEERDNYQFKILPTPGLKELLLLRYKFLYFLHHFSSIKNIFSEWIEMLNEGIVWLDISGYALGSYWKPGRTLSFVMNIALAKSRKIPVYILPQSFGPFNYKGFQGRVLNILIRHYLPYASMIMAREKEGQSLLESFYNLKNVKKTYDMVLQNKEIDSSIIYKVTPQKNNIQLKENSVAVIPNIRNNKYGEEKMLTLYKNVIDYSLSDNIPVYLIFHAIEDLDMCYAIKNKFYANNDSVKVINQELSCFEINDIMYKFRYIVASRFHSIVHAYKCGTAAIVFGWATKYHELLQLFDQEQYMFDVRKDIDEQLVMDKIRHLNHNYDSEKRTILNVLDSIQKDNIFDYIKF